MGPKKGGSGCAFRGKAESSGKGNAAPSGNKGNNKANEANNKPPAVVKGGKGAGKGKAGAAAAPEQTEEKKLPTVAEQIGCPGWTGKLPVNILHELCQKNRWRSPEYLMRQQSEGFFCWVRITQVNPKTNEAETVEFSPSYELNPFQPSRLEAKHWTAVFVLNRVNSMKNLQVLLPPSHRKYWNEFEELRKLEFKKGNQWKYSSDPFAAKREKEALEAEKKKKFDEKKNASNSVTVTLDQAPPGTSKSQRWNQAPIVELNRASRKAIEGLIQRYHAWNPLGIEMSKEQREKAVRELTALGFRKSHAAESCDWAKDKEEALEWLLIHVPEDDLPKLFLPEGHNVGVSFSGTIPIAQEYAARRLAESGFSLEVCREVLAKNSCDEDRAAEALMQILVTGEQSVPTEAPLLLDEEQPDDPWREEMEGIEAVWGDERLHWNSPNDFRVELNPVNTSKFLPPLVQLRFRKPKTAPYPDALPIMTVEWQGEPALPAHVRLSIVKQCADYANEDLLGGQMVAFIIDWLEDRIADIVENPGKLRDISNAIYGTKAAKAISTPTPRTARRKNRQPIDWTPGNRKSKEILEKHRRKLEDPSFVKMMNFRRTLPAWNLRDEIVSKVAGSQVVIISGETGSGKSTQAVQFILDDLIEKELGAAVNIICTQPRRISALGLADRVSDERCTKVGNEVGYAIRGESKQSPGDTKITFVTTGVLLRRLQTGDNLADVSHVVVDEVHERSLDTDFLLVLLKQMISKRKDLRVILMSATLDAEVFANYFGGGVEIVNIAGRTFPVRDAYLDDVIISSGYNTVNYAPSLQASIKDKGDAPAKDPRIGAIIRDLGNGINYQLIAQAVSALDKQLRDYNDLGSILIFLPGTMEITRCINAVMKIPHSEDLFLALPLHASLTSKDQKRVFPPAPSGKRKIIAATNVAETSITIDDIVAVIDTGRVKETAYDPQTRVVRLVEKWASRAACKQRRGRAGRVRTGLCWKLYTRDQEQNKMEERPQPELVRVPLEQTCLSILGLGTGVDVRQFLSMALTPPKSEAVEDALEVLERIGATDMGVLTALGKHLAMIPADLRCAKLMIYGAIFGCLDATATISAILTTKSPFLSPFEKREEAKAAKISFAPNSTGDLVAAYHAFTDWNRYRQSWPIRDVRAWCDENFLSYTTFQEILSNRSTYMSTLQDIGFIPYHPEPIPDSLNRNNENERVLRALIAGAFSPQLVRVQLPDKKFMQVAGGSVSVDPEAKKIKFFSETAGRVFLHPSSTLFDNQTFSDDISFLSYAQMSQAGTASKAGAGNFGPKTFLQEVTPVSALPLLLFCPKLEVDPMGRGLKVDGWIQLRGWGRIGVLIGRLRWLVDEVLQNKLDCPGWELDDDSKKIIEVTENILLTNGK